MIVLRTLSYTECAHVQKCMNTKLKRIDNKSRNYAILEGLKHWHNEINIWINKILELLTLWKVNENSIINEIWMKIVDGNCS